MVFTQNVSLARNLTPTEKLDRVVDALDNASKALDGGTPLNDVANAFLKEMKSFGGPTNLNDFHTMLKGSPLQASGPTAALITAATKLYEFGLKMAWEPQNSPNFQGAAQDFAKSLAGPDPLNTIAGLDTGFKRPWQA